MRRGYDSPRFLLGTSDRDGRTRVESATPQIRRDQAETGGPRRITGAAASGAEGATCGAEARQEAGRGWSSALVVIAEPAEPVLHLHRHPSFGAPSVCACGTTTLRERPTISATATVHNSR